MEKHEKHEMQESVEQDREAGASLVEYALLVGLIVVIAIVSIRLVGQKVSEQFSTIADAFEG